MSQTLNGISRWDLQRKRFPLKALGSTSNPVVLDSSGENGIGLWATSAATSGNDGRAIYARLYFTAGGGGEAIRAYGTVNNATTAVGGTVNGAHISLKATGSSAAVSGAGHALRATFEIDDTATAIGGTCDVVQIDTSFTSTPTKPSRMSFINFNNLSTGKLDYLFKVTNASTTMLANAGTGANSAGVSTGGVAAKVLKVDIAGTDYWLPLFSSNS